MVAIYIESNLMVKAIVANYFLNYNSATQTFFHFEKYREDL